MADVDDPFPFWSHISVPNPIRSSSSSRSRDHLNQVSFVLDLFHQRVEMDTDELFVPDPVLGSGSFDRGCCSIGFEDDSSDLDLDLDLGLGLGLDLVEEIDDDAAVDVADCGGGFVVSDLGEDLGLQVAGIDTEADKEEEPDLLGIELKSDDDEEEDEEEDDDGVEINVPLYWDSFHLEEGGGENMNEFEWEEVDGGIIDEREVLSVMVDPEDEEEEVDGLNVFVQEEEERVREVSNLGWEVLLNLGPVDNNVDMEYGDGGDRNGPYFAEYEMMFGQFGMEENGGVVGRPPTARVVIENLLSVVMSEEDVVDGNAVVCAVCKDEMVVGEIVKRLPCCHRYHGECILPWLEIRNTCPVCRFELPTDDAEYEQRRTRRAGHTL